MQFCYYCETLRDLKARFRKYINVSPVTFKKVKPSVENSIHSHLSFSDLFPSFNNFIIFAHGTKKFLSEIKERLLNKQDNLELDKNITLPPLSLFYIL